MSFVSSETRWVLSSSSFVFRGILLFIYIGECSYVLVVMSWRDIIQFNGTNTFPFCSWLICQGWKVLCCLFTHHKKHVYMVDVSFTSIRKYSLQTRCEDCRGKKVVLLEYKRYIIRLFSGCSGSIPIEIYEATQ